MIILNNDNHTITNDKKNETYYYIHRHVANFEMGDAIEKFNNQKEAGYKAMKARYMKNYLENIKVSPKVKNLLNVSLSDEEEYINAIDNALWESLNKSISNAKIVTNYQELLKQSYTNLNNFINNKDVAAFDKVLSLISRMSARLERDAHNIIMALIGNKSTVNGLPELATAIQKQKQLLKTQPPQVVDMKRLNSILSSLEKLVASAQDVLSGKEFSPNEIRTYLTNIVSTQIGELVTSRAILNGLSKTGRAIRNTLVGGQNLKIIDEGIAKEWADYGSQSKTFKTDNRFQNLDIQVEGTENSITINLGISTKWYNNIGAGESDYITFVNEKSFVHRLSQMLTNNYDKYLAYNSLALAKQNDSGYKALKAAIISRNLDVMISGFGKQGDFSQFIVINGEFYSIWQIIQAMSTYTGSGSTDNDTTTPITVSAGGLSKIINATENAKNARSNLASAYKRVREQTAAINNLRFIGHFYPNRFKSIL